MRKNLIVLVECDDLIRTLLDEWLVDAGYDVVVGDYQRRVRDHEPELVIADISNPLRANELIKALKAMYAAPILAMSARFRAGLGGSTEAARRLGVSKVLPKPFTRKELLCAVRESLEGAT